MRRFDPLVGKIPWRRERLPTPVFWPRELHGLCIVHGVAKNRTLLSNFHFHFPLGLTDLNLYCPRDSQECYPAPQFKSINSVVISLLCGPTITSVHTVYIQQIPQYPHFLSEMNSLPCVPTWTRLPPRIVSLQLPRGFAIIVLFFLPWLLNLEESSVLITASE